MPWNTVGVSNNILDASLQALSDGIRYHLMVTGAVSDRKADHNYATARPVQPTATA